MQKGKRSYQKKEENKFSIITYGCASNQADSFFYETILTDAGWLKVDVDHADIIIVNSCTVKGPTENKIIDVIKKLSKTKKKHNIIIAGCLASDPKFILTYTDYSMINPYNVHKILDAVNYILKNNAPIHYLKFEKYDKTKLRQNANSIAIIQPLIGCLGNCSFCKTKFAKPVFYSYPLENIISRIQDYIDNGVKEIWISSEDNAAYGKDLNTNYISLLNAIEKKFANKAMFRFGMANPWLIAEHTDELINFLKKTKAFYKFLHIPIQSASDNVLKKMVRPYSEYDLSILFNKFRSEFTPEELTLSTDVILGFPGESDSDFEKTKTFIRNNDFLVVNISQFWPRPFTKAVKMKQLKTEIKKERSRKMSVFVRNKTQKLLDSYVGKVLDVYPNKIDENNNLLARTRNYVSVIVKNKKLKLFEWQKVKIKKIENNHLIV